MGLRGERPGLHRQALAPLVLDDASHGGPHALRRLEIAVFAISLNFEDMLLIRSNIALRFSISFWKRPGMAF